jgi:hypothetical protein
MQRRLVGAIAAWMIVVAIRARAIALAEEVGGAGKSRPARGPAVSGPAGQLQIGDEGLQRGSMG